MIRTERQTASVRHAVTISLVAIALQIFFSGVRFVDGTALMAIGRDGFAAQLGESSSYLFDSQLKVIVLHALGLDRPVPVGLFFLLLNALPYCVVLFGRNTSEKAALLIVVALLPVWKTMFQNIGVGDSFTILCSLILVVAASPAIVAATTFLIILWHFQQGLIVALMLIALYALRARPGDRSRSAFMFGGLAAGVGVYLVIKLGFVPRYNDRLGFWLTLMQPYWTRNLVYAPLAICALAPGLLLLWLHGSWKKTLPHGLAALGLCAAVVIAGVAPEFSRIITILSTPLIVWLLDLEVTGERFVARFQSATVWLPIALLSAMIPFVSWSGADIYLWSALIEDLNKYLR